ncbi:hypothetical protein KPH14_009010 [Odynerus spinipes]|uniref:Little elongation complex subunit 2 C-terminal domain-containing protein n=1 Tax=Odynerus spinipes TaxID=1348599 RepID=A0AAD9RNE0_9HYME|nr:hypothetical protein KPH14_009010 [Odynerus spinipes]
METFLKIDWNPSLNDILDDVFINEESMEEDYRAINIDMIMDDQDSIEANETSSMENKYTSDIPQQESKDKNIYIPGIMKPPYRFPRMSNLSKEEHAICLRILLKFSGSEKPDLTNEDRDDLQTYMRLKETISIEQDHYSKFVKEKWDGTRLQVYCEDYINLKWRHKLQNILKLPRYYVECTNIPFISNKEITVQYITTCLKKGYAPMIKLPTLIKPYMLHINSTELEERFPIPNEYSDQSSRVHFKLPVSKDPTCESLAEANEVDLVISSSGLNCLANNIGPTYTKTWILPVTVKSYNGKNIIYIDKPTPPAESTVPEKNTWIYKYILRHAMIQRTSLTPRSNSCKVKVYDENLFGNINSEDYVQLEDDNKNESGTSNNTKIEQNKDKHVAEISTLSENESEDEHMLEEEVCDPQQQFGKDNNTSERVGNDIKTFPGSNVSYKLFRIGPSSTDQNELMKNIIKDYKILVRTKEDGYEKLTKKTQQKLVLAPKLEHQLALGAEAVTLDEALKQWISLLFRPGACLARVRIAAQTSEVIQIEKRTTVSINNEIKRLYNVKVENSLVVLHNVIQTLSNVTPGHYIIKHTARNGAFCTVYKETDSIGKNVLDLHTICGDDQFHTIPNPPWPVLDKVVITPMLKCFQRMPLMFYPPKVSNKRKFKKKAKPGTS